VAVSVVIEVIRDCKLAGDRSNPIN
jgi:hypothetical protein